MTRLFFCTLIILAASSLAAQDNQAPAKTEIDARDFQFQGEYVGEIGPEGNAIPFAIQAIAIGDGKFKIVAYEGGLPGDGWTGQDYDVIDVVGQFNQEENAVEFRGYVRGDAILKEGVATITTPEGDVLGELKKVVRESETIGAEPPEGAVHLFDGSDVEQWKDGQMTEAGLLKQGTTSKAKFGSHHLHIEFQLPFMPRAQGQQRGNSGLYLQGRYEVQMLDSFGLEGKQNECGGIYSVKAPDLNMCYPPGSWQTYDVDFVAAEFGDDGKQTQPARMTVKHNGVVIHDDVELPARKTTAAPVAIGPEKGPIYLQNHGNPVRYRNIWVKEK